METESSRAPSELAIRAATVDDLPALVQLEASAFDADRISRRSMRHLLQRAHAAVLVAVDADGAVLGSVVLLFSRGTATVRLYSIAVHPAARGRGVARRLVEAAEAEAWRRERAWVRLEIRRDNTASIGLFESLGYRRFGSYDDYYADHMEALRYEKAVDAGLRPELARVPYYRQTLDFTCGPAALLMAFSALDPAFRPDRTLELRVWREATTVFMTSGHGGCGPYGLALAAWRRGWEVELHLSAEGAQLLESVRSPEKKEVMALVQADMEREVAEAGIPVRFGRVSPDSLEHRAGDGAVPLVLISSWAIYGTRVPHWVVVTGFDEHFVYVHDPFIDEEEGETPADSINMPIGRAQFERMARYGRRGLQAALFIGPHRHA
ncbi:peptidase C39 family protein [Gaopeijia maritima]|uniref:GNAT family N-acetyltransferase/peptidase C39 family protein n=1 Tax=Gaopeijia maritima TaxID=3119007 RepID=A0ABU9EAZ3_9BACT